MFTERDLKNQIEEAFGKELSGEQLWTLVNLSKWVRRKCRSNAAFNNLFNRLFENARFKEVMKTGYKGPYKGLEIEVKGEVVAGKEEEE